MNSRSGLRITFLLLITTAVMGQKNNRQDDKSPDLTIQGKVLDGESGNGLEYATISFYDQKDSSILGGGLSETEGDFKFQIKAKSMYAQIEYISYQSVIINPVPFPEGGQLLDLGDILLYPESQVLDNIEIVADRSETTFSLDKRVFTVGKDLANKGGSAEDILDNVPSVSVDIEGNVSLRGSEGVRILIDGRPSGLAGIGNTNGLRNIPSNMIEKVEVITNPSARYEAEGMAGIINIVLKKNESGGFNGSFDLTGGIPERVGLSANLNYRKDKLNWFANYGINHSVRPGGGNTLQDQLLFDETIGSDQRFVSIQNREQDRKSLSNSIRLGADYIFTEKEQLTGSFMYRRSDESNIALIEYIDYIGDPAIYNVAPLWTSDIEDLENKSFDDFANELPVDAFYDKTSRRENEKEDEQNLEYSLNYHKEFSSREHNLNAVIQYNHKNEVESSQFENSSYNNLSPDEFQRSSNDEGEKNWLLNIDYVHPLGKDHKWEAGIRSSLREIRNDFQVEDQVNDLWVLTEGLNNNFLYDEDIQAGYFIYGNTINKISFQIGIRGEYSLINTQLLLSDEGFENKRDLFKLFPSGHFNYNLSDKSALQLSYSRRVRRPRFWYLNPFFTFSDNRNFFSGNPNVNPEYTDSYEFGQIQYWENLSLSSSLFYRSTQSSIQRILSIDNIEATTLRVPLNIGSVYDYGLDFSVSYSGLKWLRLDGNMNIFRNQLSVDNSETFEAIYNYYKVVRDYEGTIESFDDRYEFNLNETDNITWNGKITARFTFWDSDLQIRSNYRGPRSSAQGSSKASGSIDIGWSKDFLDKRLTLTLSVRDLFNNRKRNGITLLDEFFQHSEFQWRSRSSTLTASYRINQKKKRNRDGQEGGENEFDGGEF